MTAEELLRGVFVVEVSCAPREYGDFVWLMNPTTGDITNDFALAHRFPTHQEAYNAGFEMLGIWGEECDWILGMGVAKL